MGWQPLQDDADPFADMATANKDKDKAAEEDPFAPVGDVEIKTEEAAKAAASTAPSRPLLRLTETWHAEFEGGKMLRAGLDGNVHWVEDADKDPVRHTAQAKLEGGKGMNWGPCPSACNMHNQCKS